MLVRLLQLIFQRRSLVPHEFFDLFDDRMLVRIVGRFRGRQAPLAGVVPKVDGIELVAKSGDVDRLGHEILRRQKAR